MANSYFNLSVAETAQKLKVDLQQGLSNKEAERRQRRYGPNQLEAKQRKSRMAMFIEQFKSFMIMILLAAALISLLLSEWEDSVIIIVVVVLNAVLGMLQEYKAEESLTALQKMSAPKARVLRSGAVSEIDAAFLVPGDVVILETGNLVPADLRLWQTANLQCQESALTGESLPVEKNTKTIKRDRVPLGDRHNMVFSGSMITYGHGAGIVTATGMYSEMGRIARLLQETVPSETPLKRRLETLGRVMGVVILAICAFIFIVGLINGYEPFQMFLMSVSLAVAAMPEGLPAIATIVLSLGVQRMVRRNAIVKTLPAVETLGSAGVICTDKTGTLTQNRMSVTEMAYSGVKHKFPLAGKKLDEQGCLLAECAMMCNDSQINEKGELLGDPTETALLQMALESNLRNRKDLFALPRLGEVPFDSQRKLMSVLYAKPRGGCRVYVKGAMEEVLGRCRHILYNGKLRPVTPTEINRLKGQQEEMAGRALRVLAFAYKDLPHNVGRITAADEQGLIFIGLAGMIDPLRPEALDAVIKCRQAGIIPVMITGDHIVTARAIAQDVGILHKGQLVLSGQELNEMNQEALTEEIEKISVYARVEPEHKVRIVDAWQKKGYIVAMTGDGVNDAPALKRADIGAAMGITGTDVAKEAADIVLTDDNFATIVSAVEEGRRIYDNILKAVQFLLSCNVGEILLLFVAIMLNWGSPLLPIHILWVNLITDSFSALALGVDSPEPDIMQKRSRRHRENIFSRGMVWRIVYQGLMVGGLTITAFKIGLDLSIEVARTMAFAVLAFSQLAHAFNIRSNDISILKRLAGHKPLILATLLASFLMVIILVVPFLHSMFSLAPLGVLQWMTVILLSLAPLLIVEAAKFFKINTFPEERL